MPASRRVSTAFMRLWDLVLLVFLLSTFVLPSFAAAAQPSDQVVAESVLGPQWKQLSRRAGMIFAGTVLAAPDQAGTDPNERPLPGPVPAVRLKVRVDRAIAGVEPGQVLTIHEWAGAWSMHRPMRSGQRFLLFLYPPSRLGLTSPVGGSAGQVELDASGSNVVDRFPVAVSLTNVLSPRQAVPSSIRNIGIVQLERAIRAARAVRTDVPVDVQPKE